MKKIWSRRIAAGITVVMLGILLMTPVMVGVMDLAEEPLQAIKQGFQEAQKDQVRGDVHNTYVHVPNEHDRAFWLYWGYEFGSKVPSFINPERLGAEDGYEAGFAATRFPTQQRYLIPVELSSGSPRYNSTFKHAFIKGAADGFQELIEDPSNYDWMFGDVDAELDIEEGRLWWIPEFAERQEPFNSYIETYEMITGQKYECGSYYYMSEIQ